jgi:LPXTG-motif cell wall-anchored protein
MSPLTLVGIILMAVVGVMYVLRRRNRLNRN